MWAGDIYVEDGYVVSFFFRLDYYFFDYVPIFRLLTGFFQIVDARGVFHGIAAVCGSAQTTLPYNTSLCSVHVEDYYFHRVVLVYGVLIQVGTGVDGERYGVYVFIYVFRCVVYLEGRCICLVVYAYVDLIRGYLVRFLLVCTVLIQVCSPISLYAVFRFYGYAVFKDKLCFQVGDFRSLARLVVPKVGVSRFSLVQSFYECATCVYYRRSAGRYYYGSRECHSFFRDVGPPFSMTSPVLCL